MRKQYSTVSFKGQVVYAGIDVHKKQWTVTIQHCGHVQKSFTMNPVKLWRDQMNNISWKCPKCKREYYLRDNTYIRPAN